MTKRMLIDATHAEETRVVVLDGSRLEDYDVETATKKQLKGNIYLAKVVRVEPSLQAAFVEYGGNRHGFLAFAEIHPDYYQIPVADRQKLIAMQEAEARAAEEAEEAEAAAAAEPPAEPRPADEMAEAGDAAGEDGARESDPPADVRAAAIEAEGPLTGFEDERPEPVESTRSAALEPDLLMETPPPETVGGEMETAEELRPPRIAPQFLRQYKIQEVVHRRQILLVQVVKEERGAKGAALTTYISLAGRYCVLMPNSPRGGGISRKITSPADRRRLKEISAELSVPSGMGLIVRTAGANRPKPEIRRDCEYLLRLWDQIRDTVMNSVAPALIYEEASLIKRAIRDVYSRDVEELLVDGELGWHAAREFMRMLMPTHARKVQLWKDAAGRSLFSHEHVEAELDRILSPTVGLRSGGSLVINQAEALVAIDVNSGRATRERNIEETALHTNLEAAEEAARQLRLRDLAGLIVIDFIDMEVRKHNAMVERRLKEALKSDRARVQVGHISHFGLLEMSRQRLRPSLTETSFSVCLHCGGSGHVRSTESAAIHLLRMLEDEASHRAGELRVHVTSAVALYVLNHKRAWLNEIEARHGVSVGFAVDDAEPLSAMRIERVRGSAAAEPQAATAVAVTAVATAVAPAGAGEEPAAVAASPAEGDQHVGAAAAAVPATEAPEEGEDGERRRRRRRRRRRHRDEGQPSPAEELPPEFAEQPEVSEASNGEDRDLVHEAHPAPRAGRPERSRRGPRPVQRGGGARREAERPRPADGPPPASPQPDLSYPVGPAIVGPAVAGPSVVGPTVVGPTVVGPTVVGPTVVGPTPANPFADVALDLFDAIEAAAEQAAPPPRRLDPAPPAPESAAPAPEPVPGPVPEPVPEPTPEPAPDLASPKTNLHREAPPVDDRPPQPAVRPIVVGTEDAAQTEKKRGWWRR